MGSLKETLYKRKMLLIYIATFLGFVFLASFFPYTGDDWAWGSSIGLERLMTLFKNYNGRYVGNLLVLLLTRSELLRNLCVGGSMFGIVFLGSKLTLANRSVTYLLSLALFLALPRFVFRQSLAWTSGFSNYVPSILLTMIYLYIVRNVIDNDSPSYKKFTPVITFLLAFVGALFVEHITLYNVVLGVFIIAVSAFKFKKVYFTHIAFSIGSILGAVIMFTNGAYFKIAVGSDGYRETPHTLLGFIQTAGKSYFNVIYKELVYNNTFLNIVLCLLFSALVISFFAKHNKGFFYKATCFSFLAVVDSYVIYTLLRTIYPTWKIVNQIKIFEGCFSLAFILSLFILSVLCIDCKKTRARAIFEIGSILMLTAPLFVVKPIGSRCFFATYALFVVLACEVFGYLICNIKNKQIVKGLAAGCVIAGLTFAVYLTSIYRFIDKVDNMRMDYVQEQLDAGKKTVRVSRLPYEDYVWTATPLKKDVWEQRMKLFYNIDSNVVLVPMKLNDFLKEYNATHNDEPK